MSEENFSIKKWLGWLVALLLVTWIVVGSVRSSKARGKRGDIQDLTIEAPKSSGGEKPYQESKKPEIVHKISSSRYLSNPDNLPLDPAQGVTLIQENYSGNRLGYKLSDAGRFYATLGLEEAKQFILSCPPGSAGQLGVTGAASEIANEHRPDLFYFLHEYSDEIGERNMDSGLRGLFEIWALDGFEAGWSFLSELDFAEKQKHEWFEDMLGNYRGPVLEVLSSVEDPELYQRLIMSRPSIKAHLAVRDFGIFSQFDGYLEDESLGRLVENQIDQSEHPVQAVEALYRTGITGSREIVIGSLQDLISQDATSGIEALNRLEDDGVTSEVMEKAYRSIALYDLESAMEWAKKIQNARMRERALRDLEERRESGE